MASAKQLAWRKKFAKMAKSGKFRKKRELMSKVKKLAQTSKQKHVREHEKQMRLALANAGFTKAQIDAHGWQT